MIAVVVTQVVMTVLLVALTDNGNVAMVAVSLHHTIVMVHPTTVMLSGDQIVQMDLMKI